MGKPTISMAIFNSFLAMFYQAGYLLIKAIDREAVKPSWLVVSLTVNCFNQGWAGDDTNLPNWGLLISFSLKLKISIPVNMQ